MHEVYKTKTVQEHKKQLGFSDNVDSLALLQKTSKNSMMFGPMASAIAGDNYFLASFEKDGILFMGYGAASGNFTGNDYFLKCSDFSSATFKRSMFINGRLLFNGEKFTLSDNSGNSTNYIYFFYMAGTEWIKGTRDNVHEVASGYPTLAEKMKNEPKQENIAQQPSDNMDQLAKLKGLLDDGVVTQEEFDAKKKQLLDL